jgi:hypothetical protein
MHDISFMDGLEGLDDVYGLPIFSLKCACQGWTLPPKPYFVRKSNTHDGYLQGIIHMPRGKWFSRPKRTLWRCSGRTGLTIVLDEARSSFCISS